MSEASPAAYPTLGCQSWKAGANQFHRVKMTLICPQNEQFGSYEQAVLQAKPYL